MKIELDLNEEQLKQLDHDLVDVLGNLTDDQKVQLIQGFLTKRLMEVDAHPDRGGCFGYYDKNAERWNHFISAVVNGLQEKIVQSITDEILKNDPIRAKVDAATDSTIQNIGEYVCRGIISYVVERVFLRKDEVMHEINNAVVNTRHV